MGEASGYFIWLNNWMDLWCKIEGFIFLTGDGGKSLSVDAQSRDHASIEKRGSLK